MSEPTPKELFMMNGGMKHYIYKDGYGDIYRATEAEEAEWTRELIQREIGLMDTMNNSVNLKSAIETLRYHNYDGLIPLLKQKLESSTLNRRVVFANCLWNICGYEKSFDILLEELALHRIECIDDVFLALIDFKKNRQAGKFLTGCLVGNDEQEHQKAQVTLVMWSYTGMPELRVDNFLEDLKLEKRNTAQFHYAMQKLKLLLQIA